MIQQQPEVLLSFNVLLDGQQTVTGSEVSCVLAYALGSVVTVSHVLADALRSEDTGLELWAALAQPFCS